MDFAMFRQIAAKHRLSTMHAEPGRGEAAQRLATTSISNAVNMPAPSAVGSDESQESWSSIVPESRRKSLTGRSLPVRIAATASHDADEGNYCSDSATGVSMMDMGKSRRVVLPSLHSTRLRKNAFDVDSGTIVESLDDEQ